MLAHAAGHRLCKLRELSLSGAMLDVGWSALTHDAPVRLMVDLPADAGVRGYTLPAVVARVSTGGTAIRFAGLDADAQLALSQYLRTH
jgi:hypothetical protein